MKDDFRGAAEALIDRNDVEGVLAGAFYTERPPASAARAKSVTPKPDHYKVICISLYNDDLAELDAKVEQLKSRGLTKANRSALIRFALEQVDLEKVPRGIGLREAALRRLVPERLQIGREGRLDDERLTRDRMP